MKIKDLGNGSLGGVKVKTPNGVIGYWKSQWQKGVWLSDGKTNRIYPQFVDDLKDCLEWDIAESTDKINCDKKIDTISIDNSIENKYRKIKTK